MIFFFKQKTAYEMLISDWSSDGCSSDLRSLALQIHCQSSATHLFIKMRRTSRSCRNHQIRRRSRRPPRPSEGQSATRRSEEHTSELQSLMRTSYAVFCLNKNIQLFSTSPNIILIFIFSTYRLTTHQSIVS